MDMNTQKKPVLSTPESFKDHLKRTTTVPLYCHPKSWSAAHLELLQVTGLDEIYTLEDVVQRPVSCDPSDAFLRDILQQCSKPSRNGNGIYFVRLLQSHEKGEIVEGSLKDLCVGFLQDFRDERKYPDFETGYGKRFTPFNVLSLKFWKESAEIKSARVLYDYPDYDHFPQSFVPIVSVLAINHDSYAPRVENNDIQQEIRLKRRARRSKDAQIVAALVAAAQQQSKRVGGTLDVKKTEVLKPILLAVDETKVQVIRAEVPVHYINAFDDPNLALQGPLVVKKSEPLDILESSGREKLLIAMMAVIDNYFQHVRPTLSSYSP